MTTRSEIPVEHTWDASSIFPSHEAWQEAFDSLRAQLGEVRSFQGRLGDSPQVLVEWLMTQEHLFQQGMTLYIYSSMFHEVDTTDQEAAARDSQVNSLFGQLSATVAFSDPELIAIGKERLDAWMEEEPRLALYRHYFDQLLRRQAHVRSAEVEEVLGLAQDPFFSLNNIAQMLRDADMTFRPATTSEGEEVAVAQGNFHSLFSSDDRTLRRTAYESYADAHLAVKNTLAASLAVAVKRDVFLARVRHYPSSLEATLSPNNIPTEVFYNLIETYRKHLPTWHRYWAIRRQALGYDTLHVYDIKAPLTRQTPTVPYEQAVEWIAEGMRPLGDEYVAALRRGCLEERWVDIYPNQGKRSGAFSSGVKGTHPFILMSYKDDLFSLSTLAHELGHSMHSYLAWQKQPIVYSNYSLFVAEVASNFNQALTRAYLLEQNSDPDFQIAVIEEAMYNFHRYFFIMPALARFELTTHEQAERGEGLTADGMNRLMYDLLKEGYGDEVEAEVEREGITWAQFSHLYANFYVYQYATGISAAHALAERVLNGDQAAADAYLSFLSAGGSMYPLDALRLAGVEMTSPEAVEQTFAVLSRYVDRLEGLVRAR
jgi:oligoendopeptidase F